MSQTDAETQLIPLTPAPPAEAAPPRWSHRRRVVICFGVVALLAVMAAAGVWWNGRAAAESQASAAPREVATAALVKQDMSNNLSLRGTLGYGTARTVKGARSGIVTWLPTPGTLVRRGAALYRVDDQPVQLFYGSMPLFRTLRDHNTVGRDVKIVADNLAAMGYAIGRRHPTGDRVAQTVQPPLAPPAAADPRPSARPADTVPPRTTTWVEVRRGEGVLTTSLIAAIRKWQRAAGLPVTGRIEVGDVAVLSGAVRVESVAVQVGDPADAALMSVTGTTKVLSVAAEATEAGSVQRGDSVTVELPDNRTVAGKVTAVGTALNAGTESGEANAKPKLTVTVMLDDPKTVARFDSADLRVDFVAETREGALAAPVGALVALSEGGYAVQVAGGGLVAVQTGMFAKGLVEVTGDGLAEGTVVVTTS